MPALVEEGTLTKSGLLYEGNFHGWRVKVNAILKMHDLDRVVSDPLHYARNASKEHKAVEIITNHVSPALFKRVPVEKRRCPRLLWRSLKTLAKPFRLLDLPDEVRNRTCGFAVEDHTQYGQQPPPFARCSRKLRDEVRPLWVSYNYFHLSFDEDALLDYETFETHARTWFREFGAQNVKFLRHLKVSFEGTAPNGSPFSGSLNFTYSSRSGFKVSTAQSPFVGGGNKWTDRFRWDVFVADIREPMRGVEADRKMLGLQGESILLSLTSRSIVWVEEWRALLRAYELDGLY
ncbi:hypothetical protein M409DRAFT_25701 [Zasmidium cellare ATCC 36951]|uniref:Uncharacterized protein n=1 Tax=Zasmidium cellare ATCC 36951 TaxID=1080233 RepID=A0A6A6C9V2_ZASCE|nr:uncharacterized protein M409DRAFT_25701 [Zasmidium cellare ATCC 36951]KAF2163924.1 hypothetical protein M409DRAFT_25701 [Zasmidium cellare ATCC 36951]